MNLDEEIIAILLLYGKEAYNETILGISQMKLKIDMLSHATSAPAQGVGSVYIEQTRLMKELGQDDFEIFINRHSSRMDLYHIHSVNPSFYLMMKKHRTTICFVHFMPDTLEGSIRLPKFIFRLFRRYVIRFYRKAKEIVVVNPSFIPELENYGLDRSRITYIPNFVSREDFHPLPRERKTEIRKKYHIPESAFVVLGVGQVQTRKGVLDFIQLSEENPDMFFVWAGGFSFHQITDGYEVLKKEMKKERKDLLFTGILNREEMNSIYNASDVFLLPSYNELFPMALLESCNVSLPYIVRDLSLYQDILVKDSLKASDQKEFAILLRKLKENPEFYQSQRNVASEMAKKYSRENVYLLWRDYYQRIYRKYQKK